MSQPAWPPPQQQPHGQPSYQPSTPAPGYGQPSYQAPQQQPYQPAPQQWAQPVQQAQQPAYTGAVTKTRPPFPHGKHIRWTIFSLGIWGVIGYPWAYLWHRFGPTKAVSHTRFV